jgi:CDP-4-dehydro-6-deoxyglucose reductase/3-phenylpropionate/trans-cinnamate dioxygenase ferredoxin reductase subunit/phenol hydroxylase P5 protein
MAACREDQPLLDSLLRNDIWIPNACNQGTCGTCKVRVHCGKVNHQNSPTSTLSDSERAEGLALACQATPCSDVEIQPLGLIDPGQPFHRLQDFTGRVTALEDIAEDTRRVLVTLDKPMEFIAGQYAELSVPGTTVKRHYSMANAPIQSGVLEFQIRRVTGGEATDRWVFGTLRVGDTVHLSGPLGDFVFSDDGGGPMILIGGGTGMAPLMAILDHALSLDPGREIHVYQGARTSGDLYDVDRLRSYAETFAKVHYVPALNGEDWEGRRGHVTDVMLEDFDSCKGYSGYLCGPPPMVEAGLKAFKRRRMAPRRIYREKFTPAPVSAEAALVSS